MTTLFHTLQKNFIIILTNPLKFILHEGMIDYRIIKKILQFSRAVDAKFISQFSSNFPKFRKSIKVMDFGRRTPVVKNLLRTA